MTQADDVQKTPPLERLHLLTVLNWEREGDETFHVRRARLLDRLAHLTDIMRSGESQPASTLKHLLLSGQTIILEDVAEVRPNLVALLVIYNAGGRLGVGPFYIQVDDMLVSGEALIRNLLLGLADVQQHGVKLMSAAYLTGVCHHTPQLPQILSGFGLDAALLAHDVALMPLPFIWQAPDGSRILVASYEQQPDPLRAIEQQREAQPDGPFLWLNAATSTAEDDAPLLPPLNAAGEMPLVQTTLPDYVAAVRQGLPDALRPVLRGELRLREDHAVNGRFSARMMLKQANSRHQSRLTHEVEPLLTLALHYGQLAQPENARALLDYGWRLLLRNQAQRTLAGASIDTVHAETEIRQHHLDDITQDLTRRAYDALPGVPGLSEASEQQAIVVWNLHGMALDQFVAVTLPLPEGRYPGALFDPDQEAQAYSWQPLSAEAAHRGTLTFRAEVPSMGYAVYRLELSDTPPDRGALVRDIGGSSISNSLGESLRVVEGRLTWVNQERSVADVLNFVDGGDAGDVWGYRAPENDVIMRAGLTDSVRVESAATHERLIVRHRMRIAPELKGETRERGLKLLELHTTATLYDNQPGVYFRTRVTNSAQDHRLRVHLRTGLAAEPAALFTDAAFALLRYPLDAEHPTSGPHVMQSFAALQGAQETVGLLARGLPEGEALAEDGQFTLALTLLRAVGWLNRSQGRAAPGAQMMRDLSADYALRSLPSDDPAAWHRAGMAHCAPLRAMPYAQAPQPARRSFLTLGDERALLTAFKPPRQGEGMIVRVFNPGDDAIDTTLHLDGPLAHAEQLDLAEKAQATYDISEQSIHLQVQPHQILTLRLKRGGRV